MKVRSYSHFDVPVDEAFRSRIDPTSVAKHAWSPLIKYIKVDRRYRPASNKTVPKERSIMYASHRDACILAEYSDKIVQRLEKIYLTEGLAESVVAYRPLGKSNYHFAKAAEDYVKSKTHVSIICFDVSGFFDNLDHVRLKNGLRHLLQNKSLPADWYVVFRYVTKFKYVKLDDLKKNDTLKTRINKRIHPIATILEIKNLGIEIHGNPQKCGIPQGTPISASLSNLYLLEFDRKMHDQVTIRGAFYQRYCDDIIVACNPEDSQYFETLVTQLILSECLTIQPTKTDRKTLSGQLALNFQYLGYQLGHGDALIRPGAMSRQWRTARRAVSKAESAGKRAMAAGSAKKVFLKKIHNRYSVRGRNFFGYAYRSEQEFNSPAIKQQLRRLRKFIAAEMARLKR